MERATLRACPFANFGGNSPFDHIRTANAEHVALATARVVAESLAGGEPSLTLHRALDFLHAELRQGEGPLLERLAQEMIQRSVAASPGDLKAAAAELGLTVAALKKRLASAK